MKNGIVLNMKYSADDEMNKNDYVFNDLIKNKFYFEESLVFSLFCLIIKIRSDCVYRIKGGTVCRSGNFFWHS